MIKLEDDVDDRVWAAPFVQAMRDSGAVLIGVMTAGGVCLHFGNTR